MPYFDNKDSYRAWENVPPLTATALQVFVEGPYEKYCPIKDETALRNRQIFMASYFPEPETGSLSQAQLGARFGVSASRISSILSQEVLRLKATLYHMPKSFTLIDELDDGDVDTVFEWPNPAKM